MPVLETDFLKALIDEEDRLHDAAEKALTNVQSKGWRISSAALIELDLVLKGAEISLQDRLDVFRSLNAELPDRVLLVTSHDVMAMALMFQHKYRFHKFYFDSIHLSTAFLHDKQIVSSDREFDQVSELQRLPFDKM